MPLTMPPSTAQKTPLAQTLAMDHLKPATTADLRKEVETAAARESSTSDPKMEPEYQFEIDYTDKRGKPWVGTFVTKILDIGTTQLVQTFAARMGNGQAYEALSPNARDMNYMLAHMEFCLIKKPKWASDFRKLVDPKLLGLIYREVVSHEATFLGLGPDPEEEQREEDQHA